MGQADLSSNSLISHSDVFADIINAKGAPENILMFRLRLFIHDNIRLSNQVFYSIFITLPKKKSTLS